MTFSVGAQLPQDTAVPHSNVTIDDRLSPGATTPTPRLSARRQRACGKRAQTIAMPSCASWSTSWSLRPSPAENRDDGHPHRRPGRCEHPPDFPGGRTGHQRIQRGSVSGHGRGHTSLPRTTLRPSDGTATNPATRKATSAWTPTITWPRRWWTPRWRTRRWLSRYMDTRWSPSTHRFWSWTWRRFSDSLSACRRACPRSTALSRSWESIRASRACRCTRQRISFCASGRYSLTYRHSSGRSAIWSLVCTRCECLARRVSSVSSTTCLASIRTIIRLSRSTRPRTR